MYELLYTNIVKEDADLSICGIYDVYEGKEPIVKSLIQGTFQRRSIIVNFTRKYYLRTCCK